MAGFSYTINIRPHSGRFFIFGHSPKHYWLRTSALGIGLPAMHLLLATRKRVLRVVHTQLITLVISFQLFAYVFFYGFRILTHCINIIPFTLKLTVSICKFQVSVFLEYHQTTLPFQVSHETRYAQFGRYTHQYMYMVRAHFSFYYFHSFPLAQGAQYFSYLQAFFFEKHFSAILWGKHYMILAIPFCVC